jgi:hypothetical protein
LKANEIFLNAKNSKIKFSNISFYGKLFFFSVFSNFFNFSFIGFFNRRARISDQNNKFKILYNNRFFENDLFSRLKNLFLFVFRKKNELCQKITQF